VPHHTLPLPRTTHTHTHTHTQAVGLATASGLSEPLGALLAVLLLRPFVRSAAALDYVLAGTGGVMLAVCGLELWPEGRRCRQDARLLQGCVLGAVLMGWTLAIGA
jgi:ZIP family zinc transporter